MHAWMSPSFPKSSLDLTAAMENYPTAEEMGWELDEDTFKGCIRLYQVGTFLGSVARDLVPIVKEALQLWLQASDFLPQRLRASQTEAQAVQAALQAAPAGAAVHQILKWMHKDLGDAFCAMLDHVKDQTEALKKMGKVLKATVSAEQRVSSLVATVTSSETSWLQHLLMAMTQIVGAALTLASLPAWGRNKQLTAGQMNKHTGAELLAQLSNMFASYDDLWWHVMRDWYAATMSLQACLPKGVYGKTSSVSTEVAGDHCVALTNVYMRACTVWLKAAVRAPALRAHDGTVMLSAINWSHLVYLLAVHFIHVQLDADFRKAMLHALVRPDFWDWFMANTSKGFCFFAGTLRLSSKDVPHMPRRAVAFMADQALDMLGWKVYMKMMRKYGSATVGAGVVRSIQEWAHDTTVAVVLRAAALLFVLRLKPQRLAFMPLLIVVFTLALNKAVLASRQQDGISTHKDGSASSSAGAGGLAEGASREGGGMGSSNFDDVGMFDMHALLLMMYGESGRPAHMQAE